MFWILFTVCTHLMFAVICSWVASAARLRVERWFAAGFCFGGMALAVLLVQDSCRELRQA